MTTFYLPDLGEGLPEAIIREWHIQLGDVITEDQTIASMETAKALVEIPAPFSGTVTALHGKLGDAIHTGDPLLDIQRDINAQEAFNRNHDDAGTVVGRLSQAQHHLANESMQTTALDHSLTPQQRLELKRQRHVQQLVPQQLKDTCTPTLLSMNQKSMAMAMTRAHQQVVPVTLTDTADLSHWPKTESIIIRSIRALTAACACAPAMASYYDPQTAQLYQPHQLALGIAIDTPHGLVVPICHDPGSLTDEQLKATLTQLKEQALAKSLSTSDQQFPSITLSNIGSLAGQYATPIVTPPATAIVAIGRVKSCIVPCEQLGQRTAQQLPISITADHRVITGGDIARFLQCFIASLSNKTL